MVCDQWPWLDYIEENDSVLDEQPKAISIHRYGHSLNLACSDTIRQSKIIKNAFKSGGLDPRYDKRVGGWGVGVVSYPDPP